MRRNFTKINLRVKLHANDLCTFHSRRINCNLTFYLLSKVVYIEI